MRRLYAATRNGLSFGVEAPPAIDGVRHRRMPKARLGDSCAKILKLEGPISIYVVTPKDCPQCSIDLVRMKASSYAIVISMGGT